MKKIHLFEKVTAGILCAGILLGSGTENLIYADTAYDNDSVNTEESENVTAVQQELPTGLMPVIEETGVAVEEDEEYSVYDLQQDADENNLLRSAEIGFADWSKYGSRYFYNQLTGEEREYWDALDAICENYLMTTTDAVESKNQDGTTSYRMKAISGSSLTKEQQKIVLSMFRYSNPQYYFLNSTICTISYLNSGKVSVVSGIYPAFRKGTDRMEETEKVKKQVDTWQEQIDAGTEDFQKVQKIHELICEKVYYNQALVNNHFSTESTEYSQSAYSVFCTDKTVCAGYAQAFEMMCNGSGIDAVAVTSSNHEWNKVRLYDSWYNVDCTWDDQSSGFYYNYFLRSDLYYDTCSSYSKTCHAEDSYWEGYLPVCSLDSGSSWNTPGTLPEITKKADEPRITAVDAGDRYYIQMLCDLDGAQIYYNIEGRTPVVASEKNYLYREGFYLDKSKADLLQAIAVKDTYYDSAAVAGVTETSCTHDYQSEVVTEPTCTKTGIKKYTCTICGDSYTEEIQMISHTPVVDEAVAPTCETTGLTEGSHCSVCGKELTAQNVIAATGHTPVVDAAVAPACETTGLTEGSHCSVCGKELTAQNVIPATGHQWTEYKESGSIKRKCDVCGKTETVGTYLDVKKVQLSKTTYVYDGKSHMPTIKVTNTAGKKLKEGTDYTVKKPSGRKKTGIYTVTVVMKGDYSGKYQQTFEIVPKATVVSGVKAKKKAFTVSWNKQTNQTSGYQIQYATDAKFKKSVVTKNVNNTKKTKLDVTKLKAKKKYYIRIRTYKTVKVNGKSQKVYSGWSKVKPVTTKK